eukprot:3903655-Pyramimonas_sp.AAC.1
MDRWVVRREIGGLQVLSISLYLLGQPGGLAVGEPLELDVVLDPTRLLPGLAAPEHRLDVVPAEHAEGGAHLHTTDQSDAGSAGIFSRWTKKMQEAQ